MKRIVISLMLLFLSFVTVGQRMKVYSHDLYMYDYKLMNPAYTGLNNSQRFSLMYNEKRWDNISNGGNPLSVLVSYENRLNKLNSGIGLIVWSDKLGSFVETSAGLSYNYQFKINGQNRFIIATEIKYIESVIDLSSYRPSDPNDPLIASGALSDTSFDFDLGMSYQTPSFSFGLSLKSILEPEFQFTASAPPSYYERYLNAIATYRYPISDWLELMPSLYFITDFNKKRLDVNSIVKIEGLVFIGANFKIYENFDNELYLHIGVDIKEKIQLLAVVYSSPYHSNDYQDYDISKIEVLFRLNIK